MSEHLLARVRWGMGQVLRPEHFRALEETLLAHHSARANLINLPEVGVVRLSWQSTRLRVDGHLAIREVVLQMPSGALISLRENAELIGDPLILDEAGASEVPIYLHLMNDVSPFTPAPKKGEVPVPRGMAQLRLSWHDVLPDSVEHMQLAVFQRDDDNNWTQCSAYIPPLLSTWNHPFLKSALKSLSEILGQLHARLSQQISIQYLEGMDPNYAQVGIRGIYAFQALLADLGAGVDLHPYLVYRQLRELYAILYFYQGANQRFSPELAARPYLHFNLKGCMGELLEAIAEVAGQDWERPRYAAFARQLDRMVMDLPQDVAGADEVYLLIRKPRVGDSFAADRVKLSARSRLDRVHRLSLPGITLQPAPLPAFAQQLGPEVMFFRIERDEEWSLALKERNLAFYLREGMGEISAALCWRHAPEAPRVASVSAWL